MTLSALFIILFFLPGFIFNLGYYNSESIPLNFSLSHKTIVSLFITLILHTIGLTILVYCLDEALHFNVLFILFSGMAGDIVRSLTNNTIAFAVLYLIILYAVALLTGIFLRWAVKKFQLDRYHFFRIDSPWYYLFKGEGQADGVKIAATMEIAGNSFLYVGILAGFFINKEGDLDRLVLISAARRPLERDKDTSSEPTRFYPLDGHYFILKYAEMKNLNVEYFEAVTHQDKITIQYMTPKEVST